MAYDMAGITDPRREIHVVEPYDPFAYKEMHHLEGPDAGRQRPGAQAAGRGVLGQGHGNRDTRPSGGLLGVGNPIAAAGIMKCAEIFWQLQGLPGARQVKREVRRGLAQSWGDLMQVGTVVITGK